MVFREKQMGETQTVYHDQLQMSSCGQCTLLWKRFGQWKREEKYSKDKKGKWVSFRPSCLFSFFLGPSVVCNRHDENWFLGELFCASLSLDNDLCPSLFPERPVKLSFAKKDCFNCSFQYSGLFPWLAHLKPSCSAHYRSIKAADLLIDKMENNIRKERCWSDWRKRTILKGKGAQIISLSLLRQRSWVVHLQIMALLIPLQVLSIGVNANAFCELLEENGTRKALWMELYRQHQRLFSWI